MKKRYKVAAEVRQELLNRIRNEGLSVAQAAKDAGVSETTVYGWLGKGADSVPSVLEFAKLKRENKELLELVGELTLKLSPVPYEKLYQAVSCRVLLAPLVSSNNLKIVSNARRKALLASSLSGTRLNS